MKFPTLTKLQKLLVLVVIIAVPVVAVSGYFIVNALDSKSKSNRTNIAFTNTNNITNTISATNFQTNTTTPTQDPYAGWKEYYFEQYDISFKYPADWNLELFTDKNKESRTDTLSCTDDIGIYLKENAVCKNNKFIAYSIDLSTGTKYFVSMSVMQYNVDKKTLQKYTEKEIVIKNKKYISYLEDSKENPDFSAMYVNNVETGNKSSISKFNIAIITYGEKGIKKSLEMGEKILGTIS